MILRELEGLPEDVLKEIEEFIISLKRNKRKRQPSLHNGKMLAKRQFAAIKMGQEEPRAGFFWERT